MNGLITEDAKLFKISDGTTEINQNDEQVQEFLLNSFLPHNEQLYPEIDSTWILENGPIFLNTPSGTLELQSLAQLQCGQSIQNSQLTVIEKNSEELQNLALVESAASEATNCINTNVITSSIFLPNDIFSGNNGSFKNLQSLQNIQILEENFFNNQKLILSDNTNVNGNLENVNDNIEIITAHKCKKCGELFERYNEIIGHIKSAHGDVISQENQENLINDGQNQKTLEETKNLYLCGKCDKKSVAYETIELLKQHMISHHNFVQKEIDENQSQTELLNNDLMKKLVHNQEIANKKVKCMIKGCDNSFCSRETMLQHMEYHNEGMKKKFKCHLCDKLFFIWRTCRAHLWKAHKIDVGLFECSMCKAFKCLAPYDLMVHMKIHSNPKNFKPFLCSTCGEQFNRLAELTNHSNAHTKTKTWNVNCPKCDKSFANNKYLKKHIQSVHDQYKPFVCNICGHKCARKAMLDLHLRQHTGEKPYKCEICEFKTGDHNSLRRHTYRHSGLHNYSCKFCKYATIQSSAFKQHMKKNHPDKGGFFSCTICAFNTVNEKLHQLHVEKHKREKPPSPPAEEMFPHEPKTVPNVEDEETQIGLFPDHLEDTVDTGGITIPAAES